MTNTPDNHIVLHLSLIPNVGPAIAEKLLASLVAQNIDLRALYDFSPAQLSRVANVPIETASRLVAGLANQGLLNRELDLARQHSVHISTIVDEDYPFLLKNIHLAPLVLYSKGAPLAVQARRIAFVGSRAATLYAQKAIDHMVPDLVSQGWQIVSGGAQGADTMAHEAALAAQGTTIVVFGSGLLHYYPESNAKLFDRIAAGEGTLVSCFPLGMFPDRGLFPARNRVISGLSQGSVVVQAASKSGALITAQYALEQGRHVFAVPGSIFEELSAGCHELIKQGAMAISSAQDILQEFGENLQFTPATKVSEPMVAHPLLEYLDAAATLDELAVKTGIAFPALQNILFTLQLEGKVKQNFAGLWERC